MPLIEAKNIEVRHGATRAVFGVSLALEPSEIVTIVGPNGSGKSTLLRAMIGAIAPTKGTITKRADLRIGYVPQTLHIDTALPMTVRRFLNLPVRVGTGPCGPPWRKRALKRLKTNSLVSCPVGNFSGCCWRAQF
jgi:zinc transport system ATP-binding protein